MSAEARNRARRRLLQTPWAWLPLLLFSALFSVQAAPPQAGASKFPKADEECLACHGQPGFKSGTGKNISVNPEKHAASVHSILSCKDCHTAIKEYPHPARIPKVECSTCHAQAAANLFASVHSDLGKPPCESCHGNPHEITRASSLVPAKCAECHSQEVKDFGASIHGQAAKRDDPDAPTCFSCHGPVHGIEAAGNPAASVAKKKLADTCAACHSNSDFLSRHNIPIAHPVELYRQSVHGKALAAGNTSAATCSDCHASHAIFPARDPQSKINHWNVPATCGQCHREIETTYLASIHGQAMQAGNQDAPICVDCHGEHLILPPTAPASPVSAGRVSSATCGRCHSDERLAMRYNLPADRVPSYADSYHGLAMREGSQTVANCASCHGVHNIFASSDPRSTVNVANLAKTCGKCHAGAGERFAIGPVHVQTSVGPAHPVVQWIRYIYWVLIPLAVGFMVLHNLIDFLAKLIRRRPRRDSPEQVVRMNLPFRIAHWGVMLSFPTLVYTGFALKYPEQWWARPLLLWESRLAFRGTVHRVAAVVLIGATIYHLVHLAVNRRDRAIVKFMLPRFADAADLVDMFLYNLGLSKHQPQFGKFNYAEKLEYWAFLWGTFIMSFSGFLLWFNNFTLSHFPKWVADAATAVHYYEALLATFSILLWHFYMVIFDPDIYPMDLAWLTGKVPADHYRHTRPTYLEELKQKGRATPRLEKERRTPQETPPGEQF